MSIKSVERKIDLIMRFFNIPDFGTNPNLAQETYVKYGFLDITSKYGGREVPKLTMYLEKWLKSGDKFMKKIARQYLDTDNKINIKVIVNLGLTKEQIDPVYRHNHNKYLGSTSIEPIAYSENFPPAPVTVFDAHKVNNAIIPFHLVAVAGNNGWETGDNYEGYLNSVADSCIRRINRKYKRLADRDALELK